MITRIRKLLLLDERPQYLIAAALGMSPSTLSAYALGREEVSAKHLLAFTRHYQCNPEDILGYLDEPDIINWVEDAHQEAAHVTTNDRRQLKQPSR